MVRSIDDGGRGGWSVWLIGLGRHPRAAARDLAGDGLLPRSMVTALGRLRGSLPVRVDEGLSEADALALVQRGARFGAVLEPRSFSRGAGFVWPAEPLSGLWDEAGDDGYTEPAPSDQLVASVEAELGFRLPDSYVALARIRNGGRLARDRFPTAQANSWATDHVAVVGISAIGRAAVHSLCGPLGSVFMREEWGYPPFGIGFADTPTGGHQQLMLDYRGRGARGEPRVVWVDEGADYDVIPLAESFEAFIRGLVASDAVAPPESGDIDDEEVIE